MAAGLAAAALVAAVQPSPAAPLKAISPEATRRGPGLAPDELRELGEAWQELLGRADLYNGQSLYIAQQNGTALAHGIFVLGDAAMQARLLRQTADFLDEAPTFGDIWGRSPARVSRTVEFDNLPFPTDARLAHRHLLPTRQGDTLIVQTGNAQQFGFLLSTIVRLASLSEPPAGGEERWHRDLRRIHNFVIDDMVRLYWLEAPAWHWAGPFPNMRARTMARLEGDERFGSTRYYRAFTDYDLHVLAMAADLHAAHAAAPELIRSRADSDLVADVAGIGFRVLRERVDFGSGGDGFAFDRGMWDDNPLAEYAGCRSPAVPVRSCRRTNMTQNISHAQRWPLWLQSFHAAARDERSQAEAQRWREALARQVGNHVVRFDDRDRPIFANYVDGRDGWAFYTRSGDSESGNAPSSLTGWSMRHGAWAVLAPLNDRLAEANRQFCRVIVSAELDDVEFRSRRYGAPGPDRRTGFQSVTDEFGARSRYVWPCRIYRAMGLI